MSDRLDLAIGAVLTATFLVLGGLNAVAVVISTNRQEWLEDVLRTLFYFALAGLCWRVWHV